MRGEGEERRRNEVEGRSEGDGRHKYGDERGRFDERKLFSGRTSHMQSFDRRSTYQRRGQVEGRRQRWVPINLSEKDRFFGERGRKGDRSGAYKIQERYKPPPAHVYDRAFPRIPSSLPADKSNQVNGGDRSNPQRTEQGNETARNSSKPLFRDLFSDREEGIKEGWTEVRRRRPRSSNLQPLIKDPCFVCGLPGHRKRFCPKKLKMICYGCHQPGHRLSECPVVQRVKEMEFELEDVEEIKRVASHLEKFAIFQPLHGVPTPEELSAALKKLVDKLEWYEWDGSITSMGQGRFLVSFYNEFRAKNLVKMGMIDFGNFTGRFYLWSENLGAEKIFMPVSVWVDVKGLPLHCWEPGMIKQMVGKFGKFRKMSKNVFDKTTADVIKVLVEVEDISVIPKIMHCSYKSLSDDRIRTYAVSFEPKGKSLPMSEIDRENWEQTLAASGRTSEVADWREEDLITTAENANAQGEEEDGVNSNDRNSDREVAGEAVNDQERVGEAEDAVAGAYGGINQEDGGNQGIVNELGVTEGLNAMMGEGEKEVIDENLMRAGVEEGTAVDGNANPNSNLNSGEVNAGGPSNSERAAIAKGKRPMIDGPDLVKFKNRLLRPFSNSGSDSFDPDMEFDIHGPEPGRWNSVSLQRGGATGSEDEVSVTGGKSKIHGGESNEEEKESEEDEEEGQNEGSQEVESVQVQIDPKRKEKQKLTATKKRVPPPFGVLQKGGFSFGKRARSSSTSSKSASKQGTNQSSRAKSRPIHSLHDEFIADVSRNVGLKKPLSKKQIGELKCLEKARASR